MPTTTLVAPTVSVNAIGGRTDAAGSAVTDFTAEEARFTATIFGEGYLTPSTSWKVAAQTSPDMTVKVGSGTAKADHYVVAGEVAGQGNYIVRLDAATQNVTIPAAHASLARVDEIYLIVRDHVYDASSRALPQLGHRQGDNGGGNPGPDAAWKASALLARVTVAAGATSITNAAITDQRVIASGYGIPQTLIDAKGDLIVGLGNDNPSKLTVGTNGQTILADSAQTAGIKWAEPACKVLAETLIGGPTATITLSSIPQTHKNLKVIVHGNTAGGFSPLLCRINGDTSASYDTQWWTADGAVMGSGRNITQTSMEVGNFGYSDSAANEFTITEYSFSAVRKLIIAHSSYRNASGLPVAWRGASWNFNNLDAVTSLTFFHQSGFIAAGTRVTIYGMS